MKTFALLFCLSSLLLPTFLWGKPKHREAINSLQACIREQEREIREYEEELDDLVSDYEQKFNQGFRDRRERSVLRNFSAYVYSEIAERNVEDPNSARTSHGKQNYYYQRFMALSNLRSDLSQILYKVIRLDSKVFRYETRVMMGEVEREPRTIEEIISASEAIGVDFRAWAKRAVKLGLLPSLIDCRYWGQNL